MKLGLGLGLSFVRAASGGAAYQAAAVHFSTDDQIERESALTGVADGRTGLFSIWRKSNAKQRNWWTSIGANSVSIDENLTTGVITVYVGDSDGSNFFVKDFSTSMSDGNWRHLIATWDTDHAAGQKVMQVARNGVLLDAAVTVDESPAFDIFYEDSGGWGFINSQGADIQCDVSDTVFYTDRFLDLSVAANLQKFITAGGKPADPANFPANPAALFTGSAASFATNGGTGGAFTLTGTLTDAASSPSD